MAKAKRAPKTAPAAPAGKAYTLLGGSHTEGGTTYKTGSTIHSTRDLCQEYPNKFAAVGAPQAAPATPKVAAKAQQPATPQNATAGDLVAVDVTPEFPAAVACGLVVHHAPGVGYRVYEPEQMDEAVNTTPAVDKAAMEAFIAEYTK